MSKRFFAVLAITAIAVFALAMTGCKAGDGGNRTSQDITIISPVACLNGDTTKVELWPDKDNDGLPEHGDTTFACLSSGWTDHDPCDANQINCHWDPCPNDNLNACVGCVDEDGDGYGQGCAPGPDCNDTNPHTWNTCATCVDADGDGWYKLCNNYIGINGPDCNDADPTHTNNCTSCVDADGDGYGTGCALGPDCNDSNAAVHPGAAEVCNGIDDNCVGGIDEGVKNTYYRDADGDGYGNLSGSTLACSIPAGYVSNSTDCNDNDASHWNDCGGCVDNDGDGYGTGCNPGLDCDDTPATGGTCHVGCSTFYRDADGDGYGNATLNVVRCSAPAGYVANSTDCNDSNAQVHPGAAEVCNGIDDNCVGGIDEGVKITFYRDLDNDTYGNLVSGSTLACSVPVGYSVVNTDCNDTNPHTWNTCATCVDADGDGWYKLCNNYTGINGPDCNDADPAHTNNCPGCVDTDGDGYGNNCALGADCDDSVATGAGCHNNCTNFYQDSDNDAHGNPAVSLNRCTAPANYVADNTDCNDTNTNVWNTCATCKDADADTWFVGCNRYQTINGPDCNDANPAVWNTCNAPPTITITQPLQGETISSTIVMFAATVTDGATITKVEYLEGATVICTANSGIPWYCTANQTTGSHTVRARVMDIRGQTGLSAPRTYYVINTACVPAMYCTGRFGYQAYNHSEGSCIVAQGLQDESWQVIQTSTCATNTTCLLIGNTLGSSTIWGLTVSNMMAKPKGWCQLTDTVPRLLYGNPAIPFKKPNGDTTDWAYDGTYPSPDNGPLPIYMDGFVIMIGNTLTETATCSLNYDCGMVSGKPVWTALPIVHTAEPHGFNAAPVKDQDGDGKIDACPNVVLPNVMHIQEFPNGCVPDNCILYSNSDQKISNPATQKGVGDACLNQPVSSNNDRDNDGYKDSVDPAPDNPNVP